MNPHRLATSIEVNFGDLNPLNNCGLVTGQGRIIRLIGPNTTGRTTVFHVITTFPRPSTGSVSVKRRNLDDWTPRAIVAASIARTFRNRRNPDGSGGGGREAATKCLVIGSAGTYIESEKSITPEAA